MSTGQMIEILGRLRKNMNGEVTERMAAHGVEYALNYGVAIHTLKEIAKDYAPNTKLARLLYSQQVRDLQIIACYTAAPEDVTFQEEEFWRSALTTGEMAEQLSWLLARCTDNIRFVEEWLTDNNSQVRYCALLTAAKMHSDVAAERVAEYVLKVDEMREVEIRVAATVLSTHHNVQQVAEVINHIRQSNRLIHKQLNDEIYYDE
ncbi:MAG: DNA alkylation repair protein [Rikenellaceae bacterium]|nr:DNA alkylation repair protein [Rikenellaceae bacterium]